MVWKSHIPTSSICANHVRIYLHSVRFYSSERWGRSRMILPNAVGYPLDLVKKKYVIGKFVRY